MQIITSCKKDYRTLEKGLEKEAREFLGLNENIKIKAFDIYKLEGLDQEGFDLIKDKIFNPEEFEIYDSFDEITKNLYFSFKQQTGQYNDLEYMVQRMVANILGLEDVRLFHLRAFTFENITEEEMEKFKEYYINPVENTLVSLDKDLGLPKEAPTGDLEPVEGFNDMSDKELEDYSSNFSMDLDDLKLCQEYFKKEGRNPNLTELQVIDTYWSDHCRHTTFNTELEEISIEEGPYKELFQKAIDDYMEKRSFLEREEKPVSLMDMGTIQAKYLRKKGILDNLEVSPEINACALEIKVDVDGEEEDWILYFKNETHNHPTEIEPFGGASTCIGGGIRDPLSGRSWVYQAMRISGASDPTLAYEKTREDKLPQRVIDQKALEGSTDYNNQIGLQAGFAREIFHPGYEAKRFEVGALLAAAPRENVVREEPQPTDLVVLLGGRTGRDGVGAAVGSSKVQTEESLETAGAEVQKGCPPTQRQIMRLFRNGNLTKLIKRCNDFGAGGVSVAVGELADGLEIDLDKVPLKYPGLHGGEIALSESQERMACVVAKDDIEEFLAYCEEEDVEASVIAEVTEDKRMKLYWKGDLIIDLSREFLDSNGAKKFAKASLVQPEEVFENGLEDMEVTEETVKVYLHDLNRASQKMIGTKYDLSIGRQAVLYPYGGKRRATPELGMVSRLPANGKTKTSSAMAYGFNPYLSSQSPFHGGFYAVVESVSKLVAMGFDYKDIRLSFQEFFERLHEEPEKWGKPVLALLGANEAMAGFDIGSVGGKDSMSGSFEEIDVPPSLISFAVANGNVDNATSRAFKEEGSNIVLIENKLNEEKTVDLAEQVKIYDRIIDLIKDKKIRAISTVSYDGMLIDLIEMSLGNLIGPSLDESVKEDLTRPMMGSFIVEVSEDEKLDDLFKGLDYKLIGNTVKDSFKLGDLELSLEGLEEESEEKLSPIFIPFENKERETGKEVDKAFEGSKPTDSPRALIPVLLGASGEYDLEFALRKAGFETKALVIKESSKEKLDQSIKEFIEELEKSDLLALANGFVYGNEPKEPGRVWEILFEREDVKEAINSFLDEKKLIYGAGMGAVPLIKSGLIENGRLAGESSLRVLPNEEGIFVSDVYTSKVLSNNSAFSAGLLGDEYTAPVATNWGRVDLGDKKEEMEEKGQIISAFTSYFAEENIDGLASPDGQVLAMMSLVERVDEDLFQNLGELKEQEFFNKANSYFRK